jgi:TolA-binding protein
MLFRLRGTGFRPVIIGTMPMSLLALFTVASAVAQQSQPSASENPPELAQLYNQGMAEFQAGDYAKAAADLDAMLLKAEFTPQLEPAFFTVGSAYFNAGNYPKAIAAFKTYQAKFPNGPHARDVAFAAAQASLLGKNYADAAGQFAALEKEPRLREQALFFGATASKEAGQIDHAISTLEKLAGAELKTAMSVRGAMLLAQLYSQKSDSPKTIALIKKLHERIALVENIVELNSMTVELGDQLYAKKFYGDALECYRAAYPREQIVKLQSDRIAGMQRAIDENLATARSDPSQFGQLAAANAQLKIDIARTQKLLEEFQKLPSITPAIYIRMARCFYETDHKWESVVVYQEIIDRFPKIPEREPALFGLIAALADVNQPAKAEARCEEYLRDFKNGPNAETVGYMLGAVALQANDPRAAETYFGRMLETQPKSNFRDQMRYLLGNAKFMAGKYDEATAEYKKYLSEFANGQSVEDVNYRLALTALFSGKYQDALNALQAYLQKYPHGQYVSDAKYRIAVCKYAASLYDEVIADCKTWEREFEKNKQLGEVLALLADSYGASNRENDAIPIYVRSYKIAATDEVMNYSLFAASKLLQKRGEWDKVADLFNEFIQEKPDSPTVISALYWIGKAKAHEGKIDEAKKISADTIKKYIDDPRREAVELLLTQVAQLCLKKKPIAIEAAVSAAESETSPAAPVDPGAELDALLGTDRENTSSPSPQSSQRSALSRSRGGREAPGEGDVRQSATAKARVLFAKAELARLRKQPAEAEKNIARIAEFKPEDLSPVLLGCAGDYLLAQKKPEQAAKFYQQLLDEYPKSENLDFAYNGLGEIAFQKNDFKNALRYFSDGTEKIAASQKLKDLTVGRAKTLLVLEKLDEAKKVFEQVASVREWRGESTAFSVYSLGEIEAKRGRWAEANAYFQRVYVGYQKFLPWVAKAYIRSGESFEKLGKKEEAANTYRELLRNEKLAGFAETAEARRRLEAMGQQG